jgi:hypothetical protein
LNVVVEIARFTLLGGEYMKVIGTMLLFVGVVAVAGAQARVPEIDVTAGGSALALLSGGLFLLKSRRRK